MPQLIAGNWKMHGLTADVPQILNPLREANLPGCEMVVCSPCTQIAAAAALLAGSGVGIGGKDCNPGKYGPHTGDISAEMLRDAGAGWVILGHSERRKNHRETDELMRQKVIGAQEAGLTPIVCVGETEEQRLSGRETEVVGWQISESLPKNFAGVLAYEPVWSIGTGKTPTEADVADMHAFIRNELVRQFMGRAVAAHSLRRVRKTRQRSFASGRA